MAFHIIDLKTRKTYVFTDDHGCMRYIPAIYKNENDAREICEKMNAGLYAARYAVVTRY